MLYDLRLPKVNPYMSVAIIENLYVQPNAPIKLGERILDMSVDLGSAFSQDCPPISYYRVVLREKLWLRRLNVAQGDRCNVDQRIALFSTESDEPIDGDPARQVRIATAGILSHPAMWSMS